MCAARVGLRTGREEFRFTSLVGRKEFVAMLGKAAEDAVRRKTAGRPPAIRDLVTFAANMRNPSPCRKGGPIRLP